MSNQNKKRREKYSLLKEKAENGVHFSKIKFGKKRDKNWRKNKRSSNSKKVENTNPEDTFDSMKCELCVNKSKKKSCLPKIDMDLEVFIDIYIVKKND